MDRLLIVEDELQIRRGLRAIAGRAGIEIGEILECKNGEEALALLEETHVDVMFTDIRMPRMDGLALIRAVQELPTGTRPEIVVVSGYDDFNYAVEAMRYGAREYLLKPVERERVYEVLRKLEAAVIKKKETSTQQEKIEKIGHQQLKYMLLNPGITEDEIDAIKDAFQDLLSGSAYVLFCLNRPVVLDLQEAAIQLDGVGVFHIVVFGQYGWEDFAARALSGCYAGVSAHYTDLANFRTAFAEAVEARKYAFFTGKRLARSAQVEYDSGTLLQQHNPRQLARQIGTRDYTGLVHLLNGVFTQAARGMLPPHDFENFILTFLDEVPKLFYKLLQGRDDHLPAFREVYGFDTVDSYRLALVEWLDGLHSRIVTEGESIRNRERIQQAVDYVQENYGKSLNMAVVSNHISMNYSVFSHLFKECTGRNFVDYLRDIRIEKAKELLCESELRISEIAARVGYDNDKHFMKSFKAAVGVSPTQYRKADQFTQR